MTLSPAVLSLKDAATYLGISRWTFQEVSTRDSIPFIWRGAGHNRRGYWREDLDAWIRGHRMSPDQVAASIDGRRRENRGGRRA